MNLRQLITATVLAATALSTLPAAAEAHGRGHDRHYDHHRHYRHDDYRGRDCRSSGTTGLIVGGAAGALLGRQLDGGRDKTTGTLLGAGGGALLGREVGRKSNC
jgi:hypothetical protein